MDKHRQDVNIDEFTGSQGGELIRGEIEESHPILVEKNRSKIAYIMAGIVFAFISLSMLTLFSESTVVQGAWADVFDYTKIVTSAALGSFATYLVGTSNANGNDKS